MKPQTQNKPPDELIILNRKKLSPEKREKLLNMAKQMFEEDFESKGGEQNANKHSKCPHTAGDVN